LRATLDGQLLPELIKVDARACREAPGYMLLFKGLKVDPLGPTDGEIDFTLSIRIDTNPDGSPAIEIGRPVDVKDNPSIHLTANARTIFSGPQDPVRSATGTLTLTSLSAYGEASGSAVLLFTDPDDVNSVIQDWLILEVTFENLATMYPCPPE
jgi:hypothetical protein